MDKGEYANALKYYQQVSANESDVKISETALATLAEGNIFYISDLISSLGSGSGGGSTFIGVAENMYARGATTAASREIIAKVYVSASGIVNAHLKNFVQIISGISMIGSILGSYAGPNGTLVVTDLVQSASCNSTTCSAGGNTTCNAGIAGFTGSFSPVSINTPSLWDGNTLLQLVSMLDLVNTSIGNLTGSGSTGSGLFSAFGNLSELDSLVSNCMRASLISVLF